MPDSTPKARERSRPPPGKPDRNATPIGAARIWLVPFVTLTAVAVFILFLGERIDGGRTILTALRSPNPDTGASTLGNVGQVVTQVLGVAISVVAIIVELAANRYTHRITELFFRAPVNFSVMGLFVVAGLEPLWVAFTYTTDHAPPTATTLSMLLMSVSLLLLLPYFAYVAEFVNPLNIINRMRGETLQAVSRSARDGDAAGIARVQHIAEDGAEQLADVALNAMSNHDKAISMTAVNSIGDLLSDYLGIKKSLPNSWFVLSLAVRNNPDFISLADEALSEIETDRLWFEFKLLRQYEMVYRAALNENRELNYLIATNIRELAEAAMDHQDRRVVDLAVKFFNTYLRATVNARDVRTAYNVLNQYRLLAESPLAAQRGSRRRRRGEVLQVLWSDRVSDGLGIHPGDGRVRPMRAQRAGVRSQGEGARRAAASLFAGGQRGGGCQEGSRPARGAQGASEACDVLPGE